jgi:hypothetical protein
MMRKKTAVTRLKVAYYIFLKGVRSPTKNIGQDIQTLGLVLDPGFQEYKVGVITTGPRRSVLTSAIVQSTQQ